MSWWHAARNVTCNVVTSALGTCAVGQQHVISQPVIFEVQRALSNLSVSVIIPDPTAPISISVLPHPSGIHPRTPTLNIPQNIIGAVHMWLVIDVHAESDGTRTSGTPIDQSAVRHQRAVVGVGVEIVGKKNIATSTLPLLVLRPSPPTNHVGSRS